MAASIREMIEANSIPEPNSGCWLWLRGVRGSGYPIPWRWEGRRWEVSHLALKSKGVVVPTGLNACHRCDNPFCINPDHLFVGTDADNRRDAQAKGRLKRQFCWRGHLRSDDNIYVVPKSGVRRCLACKRRHERLRYHAQA